MTKQLGLCLVVQSRAMVGGAEQVSLDHASRYGQGQTSSRLMQHLPEAKFSEMWLQACACGRPGPYSPVCSTEFCKQHVLAQCLREVICTAACFSGCRSHTDN